MERFSLICVLKKTQKDLTLIDPSFLSQLSILENYLLDAGYVIRNVKGIILTHVHVDHAQSANEIKKKTGAKIYSHWIEANYLAHSPSYNGPPTTQETIDKLKKLGISIEELTKKYGSFDVEPIIVDQQVSDGDTIGSLKVIHTPGHTPGHISLYYKKDGTIFGADSIYKHVFGADGMYISAPQVSIDSVTAVVSAIRLSKIKFDKLLMAHQDFSFIRKSKRNCRKAGF